MDKKAWIPWDEKSVLEMLKDEPKRISYYGEFLDKGDPVYEDDGMLDSLESLLKKKKIKIEGHKVVLAMENYKKESVKMSKELLAEIRNIEASLKAEKEEEETSCTAKVASSLMKLAKSLSSTDSNEIENYANELVKEEADIVKETMGESVRTKMDYSDQNTKMASAASNLLKLAKSLLAEEDEEDEVEEEKEVEAKKSKKSEEEVEETKEAKIASNLLKLAKSLLAEEDDTEEEEKDEEVAKKAAISRLEGIIASANKNLERIKGK